METNDHKGGVYEKYNLEEVYSAMETILNNLEENERESIVLYFGIDCTPLVQQLIAEKLFMSRIGVSKAIRTGTEKICFELINQGIIELNSNEQDQLEKETTTSSVSNDSKTSDSFDKELEESMKENSFYQLTDHIPVNQNNPSFQEEEPAMEKGENNLEIQNKESILPQENMEINEISEKDYYQIIELLKTLGTDPTLMAQSPEEIVIIYLKMGFVQGKVFSTEAIHNFLGVEPKRIREITKKYLLNSKEKFNQAIDHAIQIAVDQPKERKRTLSDDKTFSNSN